jgi:hypothetical protein
MGWGASRADGEYLDECRDCVDRLEDELAQIRRIVEEDGRDDRDRLREIRKVLG